MLSGGAGGLGLSALPLADAALQPMPEEILLMLM
jgi:hypothetical protein